VAEKAAPGEYGADGGARFAALERAMAGEAAGAGGLLALDWANGNRCVLGDARLTGLLVGQTLRTPAHAVFRAHAEASAFGARVIVEHLERHGLPVRRVVCAGEPPARSGPPREPNTAYQTNGLKAYQGNGLTAYQGNGLFELAEKSFGWNCHVPRPAPGPRVSTRRPSASSRLRCAAPPPLLLAASRTPASSECTQGTGLIQGTGFDTSNGFRHKGRVSTHSAASPQGGWRRGAQG
jgi:hypothetical protein